MKKADYFAELLEANKIPEGKTEDDFTVPQLKVMYKEHRDDVVEKEEEGLNPEIEKTMSNNANETVSDNVPDVVLLGVDENPWKLMCKAYSKKEGWMKSTKAMNLHGNNVLVQVTTQQRNPDGSYSIAEALITVQGSVVPGLEKGIFVIG